MAYGFNDDRSKVAMHPASDVYTKDQVYKKTETYSKTEIDQIDLVNDQALAQEVATRANADTALGNRIDNILDNQDLDPNKDSELVDIRTGYDGTTYANAGDAVRGQVNDLHNETKGITPYDLYGSGVENKYNEGNIVSSYTSGTWQYVRKIFSLPVGNYVLVVTDVNVSSVGYFGIRADVTHVNYLQNQTQPGVYDFTVYDDGTYYDGTVSLILQLSTGSEPSAGTYYLKNIKIYTQEDYYTKRIFTDTQVGANRRFPIQKVSDDSITNGDSMQIDVPYNSKYNNVISFYAKITAFSSVMIGRGNNNAYSQGTIKIDSTNLYVYNYTSSLQLIGTYAHGLTISAFLIVTIRALNNGTADVVITTLAGTYSKNITWNGCNGPVVASIPLDGGTCTLAGCELVYHCNDIEHDIWVFGDSYLDFWPIYAVDNGFDNWLADGYSGRGSVAALAALNAYLATGIQPKYIVWCMGMNDADTNVVNPNWKNSFDSLKSICRDKGIELILCTIPRTPTVENLYKNQLVRTSGYRYVDINTAVGADWYQSWFNGLLSGDNVHPTEMGSKVIAARFMVDVPELGKSF